MANPDGAINSDMSVHEAAAAMANVTEEDFIEEEIEEPEIEDVDEPEEDDTEEIEDSEAEDDAEAEEEQQIESLADVAAALEVDLDEFQANLTTTIKINGQESDVTLTELKNGYQRDADYRQKTMELAETRKQLEANQQAQYTQLQQQANLAAAVMAEAKTALAGERAEIDKLQATDPQRWLVEVQKHQDKTNRLNQIQQQAAQAWQAQLENRDAATQQQREALMLREQQALASAIPDFNQERATQIGEYLQGIGFQSDEIANQLDHRWLVLADKARQFDGAVKTADPAAKRVRKLPKTQKPTKKAITTTRSNFEKASRRLKRTGDVRDAAAAILNMQR